MNGVTIKSPGDIPAVVEAVLGFTPTDSLVLMGLGGGPTARVDLGPGSVKSLAVAAHHWTGGVAVVVYSDQDVLMNTELELAVWLPTVPRIVAVRVDGDVVHHNGHTVPVTRPDLGPAAAKRVLPSREALAAEAEEITGRGAALHLAQQSYLAGDGARAWVYLERYEALGGHSKAADTLAHKLTTAVAPR